MKPEEYKLKLDWHINQLNQARDKLESATEALAFLAKNSGKNFPEFKQLADDALQCAPIAVLTLGGIEDDEYTDNEIFWLKEAEINALQEKLVTGRNPVCIALYPSPTLKSVSKQLDFIEALKIADSVFAQYKIDHLKWWRKMDGTPIFNDVSVRMANAFVAASYHQHQREASDAARNNQQAISRT